MPLPPWLRRLCGATSAAASVEQQCLAALRRVRVGGEGGSVDVVYGGVVRRVRLDSAGAATVHLEPSLHFRALRSRVHDALASVTGVTSVTVSFAAVPQDDAADGAVSSQKRSTRRDGLADTKSIIAVSSCKGGVGKSTIALNLAFSLASLGLNVSIFDADLYGPSLPTLAAGIQSSLGLTSSLKVHRDSQGRLLPIVLHGVKMMSFGFVSSDDAAVLRGPVASRLVQQLVHETCWGQSDYLVVDMPPGTGDINLSLCQALSLDASVAVTTPHPLSYVDVVKGVSMMGSLSVATVAAVQNMSTFVCKGCGAVHDVFGSSSTRVRLQQDLGIRNTLDVPLLPEMGDVSLPLSLNSSPEVADLRGSFAEFAKGIDEEIRALQMSSHPAPEVVYERNRGIVVKQEGRADGVIGAALLRRQCKCAKCIHGVEKIDDDVEPVQIRRLGNYAVTIEWNDGHKSSIYSFDALQRLAH